MNSLQYTWRGAYIRHVRGEGGERVIIRCTILLTGITGRLTYNWGAGYEQHVSGSIADLLGTDGVFSRSGDPFGVEPDLLLL